MNGIVRLEPIGESPLLLIQGQQLYTNQIHRRVSFVPGIHPSWAPPFVVHVDHALKFESIPYLEHLYAWLVYHTKFMRNEEAKYLMRMLRTIIHMELESMRQKSLKIPA